MKILVVDDSKTSLILIGASLKKLDHEVIESQDPKNAVALFQQHHPDLVILDVMMEGMDGYQVAKEIRKINPEDEWVPIIFLSGMLNDESVAKGVESGGDDYLTKPFSEITLNAKIKAMQRIALMRKKIYETTSQLKIANEKLQRVSFTDDLTEIANRRAFDHAFANEWRRSCRLSNSDRKIALIMIDIDHFKFYNDSYGHMAGDKCLKQIAGALDKVLRRGTDFLARYGGEEFVVILININKDNVLNVAEELRKSVEKLEIPNGKQDDKNKFVTISLGMSLADADKDKQRLKLLSDADMALYKAKENGRNRVEFKDGDVSTEKSETTVLS